MSSSTPEISIRSSILRGAKDLRIETRSIFPPARGELQISIRSTGLCGSDLHYYNHNRNGDIVIQEPMSLGHESSGIVVGIGPDVTGFVVGDKVALEVGVPCDDCSRCTEGRYNICKSMRFRSSAKSFPHFQGTLQEKINHPAKWCHKLPVDISLEMGALLEPLGVAIHASHRAALASGSNVLVFGAGAVGLLCAAMARFSGAKNVVIVDIDQGRVEFAVENNFATHKYIVPPNRRQTGDESMDVARNLASSITSALNDKEQLEDGFDVTFECTGVPSCVQTSVYATRAGGKLMLIGMGHSVYTLPVSAAALREVDILGVFRYANTYAEGIRIISQPVPTNMPDLSQLVTHRFEGLDQLEAAFQMAGRTKDNSGKLVLKVIVDMSGQ